MQRNTKVDGLIDACTSYEQVFVLMGQVLYRAYQDKTIPVGLAADGNQELRFNIDYFANGVQTDENKKDQLVFVSGVLKTDIEHYNSVSPHLLVQPIGNATDTPIGQAYV